MTERQAKSSTFEFFKAVATRRVDQAEFRKRLYWPLRKTVLNVCFFCQKHGLMWIEGLLCTVYAALTMAQMGKFKDSPYD